MKFLAPNLPVEVAWISDCQKALTTPKVCRVETAWYSPPRWVASRSICPMVMPPAYNVMATSSREAGWIRDSPPAPPAARAGEIAASRARTAEDARAFMVFLAAGDVRCLFILALLGPCQTKL